LTEELRIVWALFDSETATVAKALPECEVYSFGKGSGTEHIDLDLSDFETAKKVLDTYPKPDVIFASPPCESWVDVSKGSKGRFTQEKGYNLFWKEKWIAFDFLPRFKETRLNGIATALTTAAIIEHYKPKFWAIENGKTSWIFDYIEEFSNLTKYNGGGVRNMCNYYSYGFNVLKKTIIYSNKFLCLKNLRPDRLLFSVTDNERGEYRKFKKEFGLTRRKPSYKERSMVPVGLYQDIMRQFRHNGQPRLFEGEL